LGDWIYFGPSQFEVAVAFFQLDFGLGSDGAVGVLAAGDEMERPVDLGEKCTFATGMGLEPVDQIVGDAGVEPAAFTFD